jgi:hypothetical protein
VGSLKALDPNRPIREAENLGLMRVFRILTDAVEKVSKIDLWN